jgi:hypothetical protein
MSRIQVIVAMASGLCLVGACERPAPLVNKGPDVARQETLENEPTGAPSVNTATEPGPAAERPDAKVPAAPGLPPPQ